jgi:hypothetical protein
MTITIPRHLTDDELMAAVPLLAGNEREATARLVAHLAELETRQLYVPAGYSSLYVYCQEGLGYSEDAAYNRKTAAQVARRYPAVIDRLADGRLSLTAIRILAPVLNDRNWEAVFAEAAGQTKYEVEKLAVRLKPKPDVPSTVRRLPAPRAAVPEREEAGHAAPERGEAGQSAVPERRDGGGPGHDEGRSETPVPGGPASSAPSRRPIVAPLAPERYRVQFTIGEETEKKLRRLQRLLRREIPSGDPAVIFDRALDLLLAKVEGRKEGVLVKVVGQTQGAAGKRETPLTPRPAKPLTAGSRRVPSATRRVVVPRDAGQCSFVGAGGRRCTERAYLEFHHAGTPFARGGGAGADNIALHCRAHNAYEGRRVFGEFLPREIREARVQYDAMVFGAPRRDVGYRAVPEREGG